MENKQTKLQEIYEGWKNYILQTPEIEAIARERMGICMDCDELTKIYTCSLCSCFMPAKTRNPDCYCEDGKWLAVEKIEK